MRNENPTPEDLAVERLVQEWLPIPDLAEQLNMPLREVRRLVNDRILLAHRVGERRVIAVPAKFVKEGSVLPSIPGTITVLTDAGFTDLEILTWLFTPDETLPIEGAPVDMLQAGRKAEIRKRAQELAF
ncbi:Rv2175c family DNA-binding protein [Demetria terragena]|uniref:Rv2175c family DNA-binding protein n=1 Tax=Demetria terragena TaxID=63959 RepID=UPI00036DAD54|nr:Rv2175c family DNA-binding protein [Demetria terragena]